MIEESKARFDRDAAGLDDVIQVLLKGHQLIEEAITRFVESHLVHPEHLSDASLRFYQKSTLARALCHDRNQAAEWTLIHAINALRNTVGHASRSLERDKRLARVRRIFFKEAPEGLQQALIQDPSEADIISAACGKSLTFLDGLDKK